MEIFKIEDTEIILQDYEKGQGKIIIANPMGFNFSYYWGAMGCLIKDFILSINQDYFSRCLKSPKDKGVFDANKSVRNVRKFIKDELKHELPWYTFKEAQKNMREELKYLEKCEDEHDFVGTMRSIPGRIDYSSLNYNEEREFRSIVRELFQCNPWEFIEKKESDDVVFLQGLLPKIKKHLNTLKS